MAPPSESTAVEGNAAFDIIQHGHKDLVQAIAFNAYGDRCATGGVDGKIRVFNRHRDGIWRLCDNWGAHGGEILEVRPRQDTERQGEMDDESVAVASERILTNFDDGNSFNGCRRLSIRTSLPLSASKDDSNYGPKTLLPRQGGGSAPELATARPSLKSDPVGTLSGPFLSSTTKLRDVPGLHC